MKFWSVYHGEWREMKDWDFLSCKECYENSYKNSSFESHEHSPESVKFKLCDRCSQEIEKLRKAA